MARQTTSPTPIQPGQVGRVTNTRPTFLDLPGIGRLGPGEARNVPDAALAALDGLPMGTGPGKPWHAMKRMGWVRVVRASAPEAKAALAAPEGMAPPLSLADHSQPAALLLVNAEKSPEVLRVWYGADRRKPVREAITARLAALSPAAPTDVPAAPDLGAMPEATALALVAAEESMETLEAWAKAETREPVAKALGARARDVAAWAKG